MVDNWSHSLWKHEGSGIGLALTKQKVALMHGSITVSSKQDVGTEFVITIPFEYAKVENKHHVRTLWKSFPPLTVAGS